MKLKDLNQCCLAASMKLNQQFLFAKKFPWLTVEHKNEGAPGFLCFKSLHHQSNDGTIKGQKRKKGHVSVFLWEGFMKASIVLKKEKYKDY